MPYLILDPTDEYPADMMRFLNGRGLDAVVLFSTGGHRHLWEKKWRDELGERVVGEHLVEQDDLAAFARQLDARYRDGFFGLVPWDERHILLAAELSDALELGWNSREIIERFRDKSILKAWLRQRSPLRLNRARTPDGRRTPAGLRSPSPLWIASAPPSATEPSGKSKRSRPGIRWPNTAAGANASAMKCTARGMAGA